MVPSSSGVTSRPACVQWCPGYSGVRSKIPPRSADGSALALTAGMALPVGRTVVGAHATRRSAGRTSTRITCLDVRQAQAVRITVRENEALHDDRDDRALGQHSPDVDEVEIRELDLIDADKRGSDRELVLEHLTDDSRDIRVEHDDERALGGDDAAHAVADTSAQLAQRRVRGTVIPAHRDGERAILAIEPRDPFA